MAVARQLRRGIHFDFTSEFYTVQYFTVELNNCYRPVPPSSVLLGREPESAHVDGLQNEYTRGEELVAAVCVSLPLSPTPLWSACSVL